MPATNVIADALEPFIKDSRTRIKAANAIFTAVDLAGYFTTDSDHLAMLRRMQTVLLDAVNGCESMRDLSSLTKRLSDVSKEVTTLEERQRQERSQRAKGRNTGASNGSDQGSVPDSGSPGGFDPTKV